MVRTFTKRTQCWLKRRYSTRSEANTAARAMRAAGKAGEQPEQLHAYRCPHCGWFHIGHHRILSRRRSNG